jgi:Raf kinase inhibitor-like YbhB/YbcL family protein
MRRHARALAVVAGMVVGTAGREGTSMAFELTSAAFAAGATIPQKHTCDGGDVSPPLAWNDPPSGTKAFALVCEDPDAPAGTWVHWVLYDVPATARSLPEGVAPEPSRPDGSRQGRNDFKKIGYGGPCPPPGRPHRYFFRLYALDAPTGLEPGATRAELAKAVAAHARGSAEVIGRYGRR